MIRSLSKFRRSLPTSAILFALACGRSDVDVTGSSDDSQLPPPAAAISGPGGSTSTEDRLRSLENDLAAVLEGGLDEASQVYLFNAEATTDRLLEEEPDQAWLAIGYSVEARLRQIQALADRVVSELRRGVARELVLRDVASLRMSVRDLRTQLRQAGNGAVPPSLDSLLAAYANEPRFTPSGARAPEPDSTGATPAAAPEPAAPVQPAEPEPEGLLGEAIRP